MRIFAHIGDAPLEISVTPDRNRLLLRTPKGERHVTLDDQKGAIRTAHIGDRAVEFGWVRKEGGYRILLEGIEYEVVLRDPKSELLAQVASPATAGIVEVKAPIPGLIKKVLLAEGADVKRDEPVLYLDAMKLENEIASPRDGRIRSIDVCAGQAVEKGQLLFVIG